MTDLQAAIGREQLRRLPEILSHRGGRSRSNMLSNCGTSTASHLLSSRSGRAATGKAIVWNCRLGLTSATMQAMLDRGISTRRGIMNSHLEGAYSDHSSHRAATSLKRSVAAQRQTIVLPLYAQMTDLDIIRVVEALRSSLAEAASLPAALQHDRDIALV